MVQEDLASGACAAPTLRCLERCLGLLDADAPRDIPAAGGWIWITPLWYHFAAYPDDHPVDNFFYVQGLHCFDAVL